PQNPETLIVATYERLRGGFDDNDPEKKYGAGAGIYRTTDGGKTFEKLTQGLPTCNMGRIGLQYYRADPNHVYAIIETEKIATMPDNLGYLGVTAENADVGARITAVTNDSPAANAGLKVGDIIVSLDGELVQSNNEFLVAIRKRLAGEKIKLVGSRSQEKIELEIELSRNPRPSGRGANIFTGVLGGQAENLQGQQGRENEHEYGGVYMSQDGGTSWTRINTLNPRPMYYSKLRVDPSDNQFIYVLGTSLHRSKDGGERFTPDGGRGVHPDNHAMWINPNDGRHMILGNDGGVYVTYDRMETWDHHNHVAIGQYYHVGVDSRDIYNVYGGLQDNGSWGGPSRSMGGGAVNADWFRVGGGDGFVCLVDPKDPNQIYVESQGGAMQRINLKTGERGMIRPQAERGLRYRFNWKTPFILSPHNSNIHYSAGNYVFRSIKKGDNKVRISPEITNTNRGTGSALAESPMQEGVIYVGTTDGAVWITRDGGKVWNPIFSTQQVAAADAPAADQPSVSDPTPAQTTPAQQRRRQQTQRTRPPATDEPRVEEANPAERQEQEDMDTENPPSGAKEEAAPPTEPEPPAEPEVPSIVGEWSVQLLSDQVPRGGDNAFHLELNSEGELTGKYTSRRGEQPITNGSYNPATGDVKIIIANERGETTFEGKVVGDKMSGTLDFAGRFQINFEAERIKKEPTSTLYYVTMGSTHGEHFLQDDEFDVKKLSGFWTGTLESEEIPDEMRNFSLELTFDEKGTVKGKSTTAQGEAEIVEGLFNKESRLFTCFVETEMFTVAVEAKIEGMTKMAGTMSIEAAGMNIGFSAVFDRPFEEPKPATEEKSEPAQEQKPAEPEPAMQVETAPQEPAAQADHPLIGVWKGEFESEFFQGNQAEVTIEFKLVGDKLDGYLDGGRFSGDVSDIKFDPATGKLDFEMVTDVRTMEFSGSATAGKLEGTLGSGRFTLGIKAERQQPSGAEQTQTEDAAPSVSRETSSETPTEGKLESLVPGPRWVSSIEASRFRPGRVYLTLDGHRSNDEEIYIFVSENYGQTWKSLRNNLPKSAGTAWVLREDVKNENLLYLGCEFSAWVSIDRGATWTKFSGLPTVAVHEIAVHPTMGEIVAATHGRSLWIADVSLLQQLDQNPSAEAAKLYKPNKVIKAARRQERGTGVTREFKGQDPYPGATIYYSLGNSANSVSLTITDPLGTPIREFEASNSIGLHRVRWDLRRTARGGQQRPGGGGGFGGGGFGGAAQVASGVYIVTLTVDGRVFKETIFVEDHPLLPADAIAEELEAEESFFKQFLRN
ncbi:MAG TPA: PDZ domain-containing protein, partial [Pirellulaceae bacterium]|nr:PDZ domain-containing protein [Pirellulaceae bacterium]